MQNNKIINYKKLYIKLTNKEQTIINFLNNVL